MKYAIAVKSCHKNAARRAACRETWIPQIPREWDWFFLVGQPEELSPDTLCCPVSDAFADIAPKIQHACRYALSCNLDYLFVCDDDTYVRPDRLDLCGYQQHDYIGHMRTDGLDYNRGIPYAQGAAYWLSRRAMEIVAASKEMVPGVIDDGAVGRALIGKVPFTHDWRYVPGPHCDRVPMPDNPWITTHKALPDVMRRLHKPWSK